jgi:hypothetical protein
MKSSVKHRLAGIGAMALVAGAPLLVPGAGEAATALSCHAYMGDATPQQYHYDRVYVTSAPATNIRTVAHYKTTDTTKFARTGSTGHGSTNYYISSATAGYRVWVDVWLSNGSRRGHCVTSFVPHS